MREFFVRDFEARCFAGIPGGIAQKNPVGLESRSILNDCLSVQGDQQVNRLCGSLYLVFMDTDGERIMATSDAGVITLRNHDPITASHKRLGERVTDRHQSLTCLTAQYDVVGSPRHLLLG